MTCWERLGIEPTKDLAFIRKAYAACSRKFHPEEHRREFGLLYEAYLEAKEYARGSNGGNFPHPVRLASGRGARPMPPTRENPQASDPSRAVPLTPQGSPAAPAENASFAGRPVGETAHSPEPLRAAQLPTGEGASGEPSGALAFPASGPAPRQVVLPQPESSKPAQLAFPRASSTLLNGAVYAAALASVPTAPAAPQAPEDSALHFPAEESRTRLETPLAAPENAEGVRVRFPSRTLPSASVVSGASARPTPAVVAAPAPGGSSFPRGFSGRQAAPGGETAQPMPSDVSVPEPSVPAQGASLAGFLGAAGALPLPASFPAATEGGHPLMNGSLPLPGGNFDFSRLLGAMAAGEYEDEHGERPEEQARRTRRAAVFKSLESLAADTARRGLSGAWRDVLASDEGTAILRDPVFIAELFGFCREHLEFPLAFWAELYTTYEFYRDKTGRARLGRLIRDRLGLEKPDTEAAELPDAATMRARTRQVLDGMLRMLETPQWCDNVYNWLLVLRSTEFQVVRSHPPFMLELAERLKERSVPDAFLVALARVYAFVPGKPAPGVYAPLYELTSPWQEEVKDLLLPPEMPAAGRLLGDPAALDALQEEVRRLFLKRLAATASEFRYSDRRDPWEKLFRGQDFIALRGDEAFWTQLNRLLDETAFPEAFWSALREACAFGEAPAALEKICGHSSVGFRPADKEKKGRGKRPFTIVLALLAGAALLTVLLSLLPIAVALVTGAAVLAILLFLF